MTLLEPYRVVDLTDGRGNLAGLHPGPARCGGDRRRAARAAPRPAITASSVEGVARGGGLPRPLGVQPGQALGGPRPGPERARTATCWTGCWPAPTSWSSRSTRLSRASLGLRPGADRRALSPRWCTCRSPASASPDRRRRGAPPTSSAMAAGGYLVLTGDDDRPPVRISLDPGVPPRRRRRGRGGADRPAGAAPVGPRPARRRLGPGVARRGHADASCSPRPYGAPLITRGVGRGQAAAVHAPARLALPRRPRHHRVPVRPVDRSLQPAADGVDLRGGRLRRRRADKDWMQFAVHVDEGLETVEEYDEANAIVCRLLRRPRPRPSCWRPRWSDAAHRAAVARSATSPTSPQLADRDYWEDGGDTRRDRSASPARSRSARRPRCDPLPPPPRLGEHTGAYRDEPLRVHPPAADPPACPPTTGP